MTEGSGTEPEAEAAPTLVADDAGTKVAANAGPVLVTGAAGFIGFHVTRRLLAEGRGVVGIDNLNPYYDPALKQARLAELGRFAAFRFDRIDLADRAATAGLFAAHG